MSKIEDLQEEILNLSKDDYIKLKDWLNERDWEEWDKQIEADSANGKLDVLVSQAEDTKQQGT